MSSLYETVSNKVFPKQTAIDIATRYYGEEYREYISEKFNSMNILLYAKDIFAFRVMDLFKKEAERKGYSSVKSDIIKFVNARELLYVTHPEKDSEGNFFYSSQKIEEMKQFTELVNKYSDSVKAMGFNFDKVNQLRVGEETNFTFYDVRDSHIQEYINYALIGQTSYEQPGVLDPQEVAEKFNHSVNLGMVPHVVFDMKEKDVDFIVPEQEEKNIYTTLNPEIQYKTINLNGKDMGLASQYLTDISFTKLPVSNLQNKAAQYFLKAVNYIFDTQYETVEDFDKDASIKHLVEYIKSTDLAVKQYYAEKYKLSFLKSESQIYEFEHAEESFFETSLTAAYYRKLTNTMVLPLCLDLSVGTILHEGNHALSVSRSGLAAGFKENQKSTAFNEIINEFLTKQMMKKAKKEEFDKFSIEDVTDECGYDKAINFMMPMLLSFEDKLKECQLGKLKNVAQAEMGQEEVSLRQSAPKIMMDYIGETNYNNLIQLTSIFAECNYGKFIKKDGTLQTAEELLIAYDEKIAQDPNFKVGESLANIIAKLKALKDFQQKLINNHERIKNDELEMFEDIEINFEHIPTIEQPNPQELESAR